MHLYSVLAPNALAPFGDVASEKIPQMKLIENVNAPSVKLLAMYNLFRPIIAMITRTPPLPLPTLGFVFLGLAPCRLSLSFSPYWYDVGDLQSVKPELMY